MNGNIVDEWTSGTEAHEIEGLKTNEEYTLKETTAPSGYKVAAPIAFTLEADGTVKVNGKAVEKITMIDEKVTTTTTRSGGQGRGQEVFRKDRRYEQRTSARSDGGYFRRCDRRRCCKKEKRR